MTHPEIIAFLQATIDLVWIPIATFAVVGVVWFAAVVLQIGTEEDPRDF